jgi:hypothetical protein
MMLAACVVGLDRAKGPFREAMVFMIGGGNYLERETLSAWASRSQPPRQVPILHLLVILEQSRSSMRQSVQANDTV